MNFIDNENGDTIKVELTIIELENLVGLVKSQMWVSHDFWKLIYPILFGPCSTKTIENKNIKDIQNMIFLIE